MRTRFGVFAKYWTPGKVKTRLAAVVGSDQAAQLHRLFLRTILERLSDVADEHCVFYSPPEAGQEFALTVDGWHEPTRWQLHPQVEGSLGRRMDSFFQSSFEAGCERVVLVGSDSPDLPRKWIAQAFERLREHPVVLGPSRDGGYYLVGASGQSPPIFDDIAWGGPEVFSTTLERLQAHDLEPSILPTWYDVDEWEDLQHLSAQLNASSDLEPSLSALREHLADVTGAGG